MPKNQEDLKKQKVVENRERQALGRGDYETKSEADEIVEVAFGKKKK